MVTGERASLLCLHSSPPCLWGLWMDLAELLRCWGHRQGGCESSDPKVCAVWAKHLVGRTVPIGTSAALGEVPSVRIPMDYTRDAAGRKAWVPIRVPPKRTWTSTCLAGVHHTYMSSLFQSAGDIAIQADQRLCFERASGLSKRPAPNPHSL